MRSATESRGCLSAVLWMHHKDGGRAEENGLAATSTERERNGRRYPGGGGTADRFASADLWREVAALAGVDLDHGGF